jgi:DNA-binding transcriptional MocR family regulator
MSIMILGGTPMTEAQKTLNLLRGISHQGSIAAVREILQKGEQEAYEKYGDGFTNYTNTYAKFPGVTPFVEYLAERHGMNSEKDIDKIYLLEGGMHANTMVFNALGTQKPILVDEFLYDRCLETLVLLGFKIVGVPMNENGTDTEALENLIKKYEPSAFWSNIRYNNPTGLYVNMENVRKTAEICKKYQVVRHIDDAYENCGIGIEGAPNEGPVNLSDPAMNEVVLVRMTTKELSPHEKISWIACGPEAKIADRIVNLAINSRLNGHYRLQAAIFMAMQNGDYEKHISMVNKQFYQPRSAALNRGLEEFFSGFTYDAIRDASFFTTLWLQGANLEKGRQIVNEAKKMNTLVTPGVSAIAPPDLDNQPEPFNRQGYIVGIDPASRHCLPAIDKMGGFPVRLAPNACPGEDDPYKALKILRDAYEKVMSSS